MTKINIDQMAKLIPESESEIQRFANLREQSTTVRVAVFGKYNHGKSTLLNAIIEKEGFFKTGDHRVTVKNQEYLDEARNITWIDTPGLDADINLKDDIEAQSAVITDADIILLVHNVKTGELDRYEAEYFNALFAKKPDFKDRVFLTLTQIDQVDESTLASVVQIIAQQLPSIKTLQISATRYLKGIAENQPVFISRSGLPALVALADQWQTDIGSLRVQELQHLKKVLRETLLHRKNEIGLEIQRDQSTLSAQEVDFQNQIETYISNVQRKL